MTESRRRFQLHLSTCIVLMFVAGGLLSANLHQRWTHNRWEEQHIITTSFGYGFPFCFYETATRMWPSKVMEPANAWFYNNLFLDLTFAFCILAFAAAALEFLQRRASKKLETRN